MSGSDESSPPDGTELGSPRNLHKDGASLEQYQLIECIGEGSFGQVWKAKKGDTEVALKILKTSMTSEETQREIKSLEVLQELKHKYLVQTHDFWSNGDQLFIEMELANGGSLKDRLKAWQSVGRKGIPEGELLKYFSEIAEALDYLHSQRPRRFLHRDVKPANILLVGGIAKLADFGLLRKVAGDNTGTKTQGGTPVFMAPESIKSDVFSPRTDLYSLAVTYAELRQGKLPFSGTTEYQVCNNILTSPPELGDELTLAERQVLLKALDKDPNQRHASCGEFVEALKVAIPPKISTDGPGEATIIPTTSIDMGTAPRNVYRRSATSVPRQAIETQPGSESNYPTPAPPSEPLSPASPSRGILTPILAFIAVLILAGMGVGIWLFLNRDDIEPVPTTRALEVRTVPPGATVYIDGQPQAKETNATLDVPNKVIELRLKLAGYKEVVQQIEADQKSVETVLEKTPLPQLARKVQIKTIPTGAIVYVDQKRQAKLTDSEYEIPIGAVRLRLELAEHKPIEHTLDSQKALLELTFEKLKTTPLVRTLEITTTPEGASVYINGVAQKFKTNGKFEVPSKTFNLRLVLPDFSEVEQTIDPKQAKFEVALKPIPTRSYALLIGINQPTKQLPDFLHAEADVAALGRTLAASGMAANDILVLTQGNKAIPNANAIRKSLNALVKNATKTDTVVVALVGHVVAFPGKPINYVVPAEADLTDIRTLIPLPELFKQLQDCPARHKLMVIDGWRTDLFPPPTLPKSLTILRERAKVIEPPGDLVVWTSCSSEERGIPHGQHRHGLFVHQLIRGLQGAASVNAKRQIPLDTLASFVARTVSDDAKREQKSKQTPELSGDVASRSRIQFAHTDALIRVNEGILALDTKKYDQALVAFNDAAVKNPAYLDTYLGRALAHYHKAKDDPIHFELAIQECERVLKADPRNGNASSYLAQIAAAKAKRSGKTLDSSVKEFQRAFEYHQREIELDPQWAMPYNSRGVTYAMRREYGLAIKDYTEAIRLNPSLKFPYENRGFAYTTQKDNANALKDFDKAIELNPGNALNHARRGGVYRALSRLEAALDDLNTAVELDAANANFLYSRGVIQVDRKEFGKAIEDFTETMRVAKMKDKETLYGRGFAYNEKGVKDKDGELYEKAIADLTEALALNPKYVPALYVRGVAYQNKARTKMNDVKLLDLAIQDFDQAIELKSDHANAYYSRGRAYRAKGQKQLGDADIKKAREIDPNVGQSQDDPG